MADRASNIQLEDENGLVINPATSDNQTNGNQKTRIIDSNTDNEVNIQYPLSIDWDSVYAKDIWIDESITTGWTDEDSTWLDLALIPFTNLNTRLHNWTSDNPKILLIHFNRTVSLDQVWLWCVWTGESFSNVKIVILWSWWVERTALDDSSNNTKYKSRNYQFWPELWNAIKLEFYTSDAVCISNITVQKVTKTATRIQALKPDGTITDIWATNNDNLRVSVQEYWDTPSIDAFARLRVSENFTIFDSKQLHDKQPLFWDEELWWSATSVHNSANAATVMSVTADASDYVIRQTKQRFNYQPWKSQLIFLTFYCPQTIGTIKRIWIFDGTWTNNLTANNGIFLETNWTISWNIAKNWTTTETVTQDNWNLDKLDWTGRSWITYNPNSVQILVIDYEWLWVGRVRVGFVIDWLIYYVHYFNHANDSSFTSVYMSSPNLPVRYDITTDWTVGCALSHICGTVISEGWIEKTWVLRATDTDISPLTWLLQNVDYAVVWIRLKSTYKDISVIPESMSMMCSTNDRFKWEVVINPTINWTFTYADKTNSAIQEAIGTSSNTISDKGIVIASGYASTQSREVDQALNTALRIGSTISWVQDTLVLLVTPLSSNATIYWGLNYRELL